jgi:hypothetical protein
MKTAIYIEECHKPTITVYDRCLRASCWQGEFMCQDAKFASVAQE